MKSNFKKRTNILFFFSLFFFPVTNSFGGATVDVHGKVKSYNEGVYQIQTDRNVISVECSKLLKAYTRQFTTGQQVSLNIPTSAVLSYREITNSHRSPASLRTPVRRAPASVIHQKVGIGR